MTGETAIINTLGELEVLAEPEENGVPLSEFAIWSMRNSAKKPHANR